ncbi:MAG: hypothetical protein Q9217_003084 [Psora testacea]
MPGLVRKIIIFAAIDGLILQPVHQRNNRPLLIDYKTHKVSIASRLASKDEPSIDCHGIVGIRFLTVAPFPYLVAISARQQVAQVRGIPIYVVTDVTIIPLSSYTIASEGIKEANRILTKGLASSEAADSDSELSDDEASYTAEITPFDEEHASPSTLSPVEDAPADAWPEAPVRSSSSNVAQDVIGRKGQYGRFAERWFSKKGWSTERRRAQGMSVDEPRTQSGTSSQPSSQQAPPSRSRALSQNLDGTGERISGQAPLKPSSDQADNTSQNIASTYTLLPKLIRTTRMLLTSRSFFFSYDLDITRRLGGVDPTSSELPLHKAADPLFFWNLRLLSPLLEGGHTPFLLPLMQGFVGQRAFSVDSRPESTADAIAPYAGSSEETTKVAKGAAASSQHYPKFLITLVSRRSIKRPGLRYLRRGIDDEGQTANFVETEQILSKASWAPTETIYSFTQIRGSIPLFFSQSPYSFKPVPVLQHSTEVNQSAFKRHFKQITSRYGDIQIVLLVDKAGGEKAIGEKYEAFVQQFNEENGNSSRKIGFEWFDFHNVCRGMKFENVSLLMETLGGKLDKFGATIERNGRIEAKQNGVARTNCMDCLDRTNVVQSAFGQRALEQQLLLEGYEVDFRTDQSTQWFNTLWADNGDAISKQYSSTAALKGDYTRTRQRNYRGAINDLGLTLSRYYNNVVNDYFSQAAIDYLLGNVTAQVFEDFEENMMSRDPSMSMQKVRENAISTSSKIVIEESSEDLVGGWTLLSPRESNTVRMLPLEEVILLVTDAALYKVCFDWSNEKVSSFEGVDLRNITGIVKGTYVTSTLTSAQADEARNGMRCNYLILRLLLMSIVGFVVKYRPGKNDVARVNTRALSNAIGLHGSTAASKSDLEGTTKTISRRKDASPLKILAFKALPSRSSIPSDGHETQAVSEKHVVSNICDEIKRASLGASLDAEGNGAAAFVEDRDIISLQEAKKSTGLVEQWSHSLKRMVWG